MGGSAVQSKIRAAALDGVFVPRFGLFPEYLKAIRSKTNLPIEVHMMVQDPEPYIQDFVNAGATMLTPRMRA